MIPSCSQTAQRTGSSTLGDRRTTQAAVTADLLHYLPPPIGELPVTVPLLLTALANHDGLTYVHSMRVAQVAWWLTHAQGQPPRVCWWACLAGLLHDIGKIYIPRPLLQKGSSLVKSDLDIIQTHAAHGAQLVKQYVDVAALAPIIAAQYERPDGGGTPNGLQVPEIPTTTYVIAVAEALDTLANPPGGTLPASIDAICNTLLAGAGWRWDAGIATLAAQFISGSAASSLDLARTNTYISEQFLVA